ncbi:hypothetical protein [Halorarum halobium]|uniref:hypothetical protein n=1 Tax=Halorarum halobium TaxID=3075121 RepID=UPI0028B0AF91|nr:hypothetical protein [Halobaculum sp. XH14]
MVSPAHAPRFCPDCGTPPNAADRFCAQCGRHLRLDDPTAASADADPDDIAWLRRRVEDFRVRGWAVEHDHGDRVVLVDRGFGSLPVHLVLLVLTGGFGNLLYAWYRRTSGAPRREVRADGTERSYSHDAGLGVDPWTAAGATLGFLLVVAAAVTFAAGAASVTSGPLTLLSGGLFLAVAFAVTLFPLAARQGDVPRSTHGRKRTVTTDRVRNPPERCAACGGRVRSGVRRGYADRWYLAGLPLRTYEEGENVYCRHCFEGSEGPSRDGTSMEGEPASADAESADGEPESVGGTPTPADGNATRADAGAARPTETEREP